MRVTQLRDLHFWQVKVGGSFTNESMEGDQLCYLVTYFHLKGKIKVH